MIDKLTSFFSRLFFTLGLLLLFIAIIDWFLRFIGYKLFWLDYLPGRVIDLSALLMIIVIAMLLRQIRENLKSQS